MGGRDLPVDCPHGKVLDWGDFGPGPVCKICNSRRHVREPYWNGSPTRLELWGVFISYLICRAIYEGLIG